MNNYEEINELLAQETPNGITNYMFDSHINGIIERHIYGGATQEEAWLKLYRSGADLDKSELISKI